MTDAKADRDLTALFRQQPIGDTFRLSFLANTLVLPVYEEIRRRHGLTRAEYLLAHCLAHVPRMTAQEVARITGRPRNSISRAVHRMVDLGHIRRSPDPDDGRQSMLEITDQGRTLVAAGTELFHARQELLLGVLAPGERRTLDRLLQRLAMSSPVIGA